MKSLFYLVLLCLLPLAGHSQFCAQANNGLKHYFPVRSDEGLAHVSASRTRLDDALIIESLPVDADREGSKTDVAENEAEEDRLEDDDAPLSKKYFESGSFASSILFMQTLGYLAAHAKKVIPFYTDFSNTSTTYQYLIYQVFRI